jgi:hypothetical protein
MGNGTGERTNTASGVLYTVVTFRAVGRVDPRRNPQPEGQWRSLPMMQTRS